jgi:hypothetical protein
MLESMPSLVKPMLPMLAFALFGLVHSLSQSQRSCIYTLPVLLVSLRCWRDFFPNIIPQLQIVILVIWALCIANIRADGIAGAGWVFRHRAGMRLPPLARCLILAFSVGIAAWLFYAMEIVTKDERVFTLQSLLPYLGIVFLLGFGLRGLLLHVVSPLVVLKKEERTEALADYGGVFGPNEQYWYIRFTNDPAIYHVSSIFFRRMRNRVGSVYSYRKKTCPLGVATIGGVSLAAPVENQTSQWEQVTQQPKAKRLRNICLFMTIPALILLLALFGYIFTR